VDVDVHVDVDVDVHVDVHVESAREREGWCELREGVRVEAGERGGRASTGPTQG